jgi:hypothetical protein
MATALRLPHWIALAAAGGAAFFAAARLAAPDPDGDVALPVARADAPRSAARAAPTAAADPARDRAALDPRTAPPIAGLPQRTAIDVRSADAFKGMSWNPPAPPPAPPPPAAIAAPTPAPSAPPLPFRFVGLLERKTDRPTAFLAKGEALLVVHAGDVIDNTYRVESLSPAQIVVTYLPLDQRQTLGVAGGQQ